MHFGWAIEGAIGSFAKIDASYLSSHVNLSARLESATKQYGVPILLSKQFIELLSQPFQERCRHIDRIAVKGSKHPIDLYTFDFVAQDFGPVKKILDSLVEPPEPETKVKKTMKLSRLLRSSSSKIVSKVQPIAQMTPLPILEDEDGDYIPPLVPTNILPNESGEKTKTVYNNSLKSPISRQQIQNSLSSSHKQTPTSTSSIHDSMHHYLSPYVQFQTMQERTKFAERFERGLDAYIKGDWRNAATYLNECQTTNPNDGPTCVLLSYMAYTGFMHPEGWSGYRALQEK